MIVSTICPICIMVPVYNVFMRNLSHWMYAVLEFIQLSNIFVWMYDCEPLFSLQLDKHIAIWQDVWPSCQSLRLYTGLAAPISLLCLFLKQAKITSFSEIGKDYFIFSQVTKILFHFFFLQFQFSISLNKSVLYIHDRFFYLVIYFILVS